ncbi:hypothetical protein A3K73_06775 [Candidatus Pacearchaeota archaeon RBG_13_36_9]|nr:MAG: hypothetical protein A3K73_06775 [Candidatus Pacearchaeota archaeon RBG_13_36_9]
MKKIYQSISKGIIMTYLGLVGVNVVINGTEAIYAVTESKKDHYGANLQQQWKDYSNSSLEKLIDGRMLIPFSSFVESRERPLSIKMSGDSFGIKFDSDE